jgi:hypothetical protein
MRSIQITLDGVFERVGKVPDPEQGADFHHLLGQTDYDLHAPECGILLSWPRKLSWLSLRAKAGEGDRFPEFGSTPQALLEACDRRGARKTLFERQLGPEWLAANSFLAGAVTLSGRDLRLLVAFEVDTNAEAFCAAARRSRHAQGVGPDGWYDRHELAAEVRIFLFDQKAGADLDFDEGELRLVLKPASPVPPDFDGLVALDLGNTSSSLVRTPKGAENIDAVEVLDADRQPGRTQQQATAMSSQVRIDAVRSFPSDHQVDPSVPELPQGVRRFPGRPSDDFPQAVGWTAGKLAATGSDTHANLLLGAKRLAACKDPAAAQAITTLHKPGAGEDREETVEVLNRLPLELIAARLFERYREALKAWPKELAVTYPTTYSRWEIEQTRRTVQRAWLRMQVRAQTPDLDRPGEDEELNRYVSDCQAYLTGGRQRGEEVLLPRLMIDEASAAAFFFLYRKIFQEMTGRLVMFDYLYPRGLNLLLYDCGGGTTDVALVKAALKPESNREVLTVSVRARSGVRDFGGDDVTVAVARVLKAKLVYWLGKARSRNPPAQVPTDPADPGDLDDWMVARRRTVKTFLDAMKVFDSKDEFVPTRELKVSDGTAQRRREFALTLWSWAEELKRQLETQDKAAIPEGWLRREVSGLARHLLGTNDQQVRAIVDNLKRAEVHRWEVSGLVFEAADKSVARCNALIHDRLDGEEVHWVVASGNGSRFPLIKELLLRKLDVPFVEERFDMDRENLKLATAKGAVLALNTITSYGNVRVEFDSRFEERLPFDVGYKDQARGTVEPLFHEGDRYEDMREQKQPVPMAALRGRTAAGGNAPPLDTFTLYRRFPGEGRDDWSIFLQFAFPAADGGIRGDLEVEYRPDDPDHPEEFCVRDTVSNEYGKVKNPSEQDQKAYRSPAQRGDI